jgi:protease I
MDEAIADGNLITAPAWPALHSWLAKFLEVLGTKTPAMSVTAAN